MRFSPLAVVTNIRRPAVILLAALAGAITTLAQNFPSIPNPTPNAHYEMLYNPSDGFLYAYIAGDPFTPTLISQIDPKTANVIKTISLSQFSLQNFELSPTGDYLYVKGSFAGNTVSRYHLPDFQLDAQYSVPLGNAPYGLGVSPSDSHVYAVATESFSGAHTVQLFRDGVQIGPSVTPTTSAGSLIFLSDSRLLELTGTGVLEFSVSSGGLAWDGVFHTIVYAGDLPRARNNRLYTTTGLSIDTNNWSILGSFIHGVQFEPSFGLSPDGDTAYYSLGTNVVGVFSTDTFNLKGTVTVPNGNIQAVMNCGSDILAVSKGEGIYLVPLSSMSSVAHELPSPSIISPEGVQELALPATGIAYDKSRNAVYAITPNAAGATANSVVLIDPATAAVKNFAYLGSDPSQIVVSDSGSAIHVALYGARSVATVDPVSLATRRITPLSDTNSSAVFPGSVAAVPGSDTAFAVARDLTYAIGQPSPFPATLAYENGLPLPVALKNTGAPIISGTIAGQVFQWNSATIQRLLIDSDGVHVDQQQPNTLSDIVAAVHDNIIYTLAGNVYQFGNTQPVQHFAVHGSFASLTLSPDGAILYLALVNPGCYSVNQVGCSPGGGFYAGTTVQLTAMDAYSLEIVGQYTFNLPDGSINTIVTPLIVATEREIYLDFRGYFITRIPLSVVGFNTTQSCAASGFSLRPNPILAAPITTITFTGSVNCPYEIRDGSSSGPVIGRGPAGDISAGFMETVTDGETFYLQPAGATTSAKTLASVTAQVRDALVASCTVSRFAISPSPIFSGGPNATATLSGNVGCDYDIRVGSPDGALFSSGMAGSFSTETGDWVTNNLVFYLQARGYLSSSGTLATAIAKVRPATAPLCSVTGFGASSSPIRTNGVFGSTILTGAIDCPYEIRVGSTNGALFASGIGGDILAPTGNWVTDGMTFFLQTQGEETETGTLAVFTARFQPAGVSACSVHELSASPNPIRTDGSIGQTTIIGTSDCAYDIRVGSPDGALFATGDQGAIQAKTGDWVTDKMKFYVQAHDDTTPAGTLGLVTAHILSAQPPAQCTASSFGFKDSPIRSNSLFGATTITGNVDCAYDIRVAAPDGALFASGEKGAISVQTGNWVSDGVNLYLQPSGNTAKEATLGIATTRIQPPASSCVGSFDAKFVPGSDGYGVATLTGNVSCAYDIRVGGPDGALFASQGKGIISLSTGDWVTDGFAFYLQTGGSTSPDGTLAVARATAAQ